jgi:hypothetical protein
MAVEAIVPAPVPSTYPALKTSSKGSFTMPRAAQMPTEWCGSVGINPVWSPNWYDYRAEGMPPSSAGHRICMSSSINGIPKRRTFFIKKN